MPRRPPRRIALLWPRGFDPSTTISLPLGYLKAGVDPGRHEVRIFDCALDKLDATSEELRRRLRAFDPDVVGVSSWSPMFPEATALLRAAREVVPEAATVLGGAHASAWPLRCLEHAEVDFVFAGEADLSFPCFLRELEREPPDWSCVAGLAWRQDGEVRANEPELPADLDRIAPPDMDAMRLADYQRLGYRWNSPPIPNAPLWVTRGCPYRCRFCAAPRLNGRRVRAHSIDYMRRWIAALYERGVRWFNIVDDNFTFDVGYAKDFCRAVLDMRLAGAGFGTPNGVRFQRGDPELWALMKRAGWTHLVVAPESGSLRTLERMGKDIDLSRLPSAVRDIRQAGLKCHAFFIVGYPGETPADLDETVRLIRRCRFDFVFLANFQPLPGTPVYEELVASGEIRDGLLPFAFSDGVRSYTPPGLRDYNFSRLVLRTHMGMLAGNPRNVPHHLGVALRMYRPAFVLRKLLRTGWTMLRPEEQRVEARVEQRGDDERQGQT